MEQLVILIVVGVIAFINWLIKRSAEVREQREIDRRLAEQGGRQRVGSDDTLVRPTPVARPIGEAEQEAEHEMQESMRCLMQAFGMSEDEKPVFEAAPAPPPMPTPKPKPVVVKQPKVRQAKLRPFKVPQVTASAYTPTSTAAAPRKKNVPSVTTIPQSPWKQRLAQSKSVREAIVLSEILRSPKALS